MLRRPATEDGGTSRNDRLFGQLNYYGEKGLTKFLKLCILYYDDKHSKH